QGLGDVDAGAGRVSYIHTQADARVHVADDGQRIGRAGEMFVFGAVVVDGDADVVFLHHRLDERQRGSGRRDDHHRHTALLRILEVAADVAFVFLMQVNHAAAYDFHACVGERFAARGQLLGSGVVG